MLQGLIRGGLAGAITAGTGLVTHAAAAATSSNGGDRITIFVTGMGSITAISVALIANRRGRKDNGGTDAVLALVDELAKADHEAHQKDQEIANLRAELHQQNREKGAPVDDADGHDHA